MPPLSPPSTLSITEEILEFINQSRAREGLSIIVDTTVRTQRTVLAQMFHGLHYLEASWN